jgi:TM2 domain-containing membrane protein YozV
VKTAVAGDSLPQTAARAVNKPLDGRTLPGFGELAMTTHVRTINQRQYVITNTHSLILGYALWLFGFMGAHRFYYGKKLTGTIWFFTLGLLGVGWLVDLFLIPRMDDRADVRYVPGRLDYSVAWLLLTFLGFLGIHRFYQFKWITGVIWLVTGGLLGIGWLYDLWTLNEQVADVNRQNR